MNKLTHQNLCDSYLRNCAVLPAVAWNHGKRYRVQGRRLSSKSRNVRREGGNLSAQTANSFPYLHRFYQYARHHSLHNRELHQHRRYNNRHYGGQCHEIFNTGPDDALSVGSAPEFRVLVVMILNISVIRPV